MSDDGHGAGDGMATGVATALVELRQIGISFERAAGDPLVITDGFDLSVFAGSLTCIAGRSGSGKTSVLRVAAGLATPTASLDRTWADAVIEELRRYVDEHHAAALVASHDPHLIAAADQVVYLESDAAAMA